MPKPKTSQDNYRLMSIMNTDVSKWNPAANEKNYTSCMTRQNSSWACKADSTFKNPWNLPSSTDYGNKHMVFSTERRKSL